MFQYDTESLSMIQGHTIKTLKVRHSSRIYLSLETRLRAVFVFINNTLNDASLTLQRKKFHFILKSYVRITLRVNKYKWSYDSQSVNHGIWM